MRDIKVIIPGEDENWNLDVDIIDGDFLLLEKEEFTQDQRASIAAYKVLGSVPGYEQEGVDWTSWYQGKDNLVQINNQVNKAIQDDISPDFSGGVTSMYIPQYNITEEGELSMALIKGVNQ